jgi:hypothetical protein
MVFLATAGNDTVPAVMPDRLTVIAILIVKRPLCFSCLAARANEPSADELEASLQRIGRIFTVRRAHGWCRACGLDAAVVWIDQPE